jgi:hypothetical protein
MGRLFHAAAATLALATTWAVADAGCSSDLTATSPGHDLCSETGLCLAGFECEAATNTCVPSGGIEAGPDATAMEAGPDGTAMEAGPDGSEPDASEPDATPDASEPDAGCGGATPDQCEGRDGGAACVSTKTDPQFCGDCTTSCTGGQTCTNGSCVVACPPGTALCGGSCVNTQSDPDYCGNCTTACSGTLGLACQSGSCEGLINPSCNAGDTVCQVTASTYACANTQTDPMHCGTCATACTDSEVCLAGACKPYVPVSGCWECSSASQSCCPTVAGQLVCVCP